MANNIPAYIYVYHLGWKFELPTLPTSFTNSTPVSFTSQPVLSRSAPQITWTGSGPRTVNFDLTLHRHLFALENPLIDEETKKGYVKLPDPLTGVQRKYLVTDAADVLVNVLSSLAYPKYLDAAKAIVPPSLLLRYGNEMRIRGVPDGQISVQSEAPWLKNGKMAMVKIQFTIKETEPYSAQYVAENGGLRGISTTLDRSSVWQY